MEDKNAIQRALLNAEGYGFVLQTQQQVLNAVSRGDEAEAVRQFRLWVPKGHMFPALEMLGYHLRAIRQAQGCMLLSLLLHAGFLHGCSVAGLWVVFERYTGALITLQEAQEFAPLMEAAIADICRLYRALEREVPAGRTGTVCQYINLHLGENLTLQQLARQAGLSAGYLNVLFRKELGCTVYEYVLRRKLYIAKLMLADPDYPISRIAADLAFSSASHFARFFAAQEGCTPSQFRKQNLTESAVSRLWRSIT